MVLGLVLGVAGCSDDGFAPAEHEMGTTGGRGETGSVNTSATITASAGDADASSASASQGGSSGGLDDTGDVGGTSGAFDGSSTSRGDDSGDAEPTGTTGEPEIMCVAAGDCACVPSEGFCEAVPPACPPGTVPEVDEGLACWTFSCVPAETCAAVPDCEACGEDLACVISEGLAGPAYGCEPVDPACMGVPSCECMPYACVAPSECLGAPLKSDADLACA